MGSRFICIALILLPIMIVACEGNTNVRAVASNLERRSPVLAGEDLQVLYSGMRELAFDLYARQASGKDNLVMSPASIQIALAMAYAGARGETASQMAQALRFALPAERLHAALNTVDTMLASRNRSHPPGHHGKQRKIELSIANALWGQDGFVFQRLFLDTLATEYGSDMKIVEFKKASDEARKMINGWVADQTNDRIEELVPQGVLNELTRLVLTNAVYLDATWAFPFEAKDTNAHDFVLLDDSKTLVQMMCQSAMFPYAKGPGWQAVELAYVGGELAMLILVPDTGRYAEVEQAVAEGVIEKARISLVDRRVELGLPKFEFRSNTRLADLLRELGMRDAFDRTKADFSGMTTKEPLCISEVLHEAFIKVDEEGTEAAAATAVVMELAAALPPEDLVRLIIDRPFIFSLHDRKTGVILFLGRVLNPGQ